MILKKTTFFFVIFCLISSCLWSQEKMLFPKMEAETLQLQQVQLPSDLSGKFAVVGIAYSKKSEELLKAWFDAIYQQFIYRPEKKGLFDIYFDVHTYFIPMFSGIKKAGYKKVLMRTKKEVDPKLHPHLLFYKGELGIYKRVLQLEGKELPYIFVLDPEGYIVHQTKGKYSTDKMQEIVNYVSEAMDLD